MTTILLNIGLEYRVNDQLVDLHPLANALLSVESNLPGDVSVHRVTRVESQTEPTACIELRANPGFSQYRIAQLTRQAVYRAAEEMGQDAIAFCVIGPNGLFAGDLIGPRAKLWGEFNPHAFICDDGRTLGQRLNLTEEA